MKKRILVVSKTENEMVGGKKTREKRNETREKEQKKEGDDDAIEGNEGKKRVELSLFFRTSRANESEESTVAIAPM